MAKYKIGFFTTMYVEVEADSKEEAIWKASEENDFIPKTDLAEITEVKE